MKKHLILCLLAAFTIAAGCSEDKDDKKGGPKKETPFHALDNSTLTVTDLAGLPLKGAQILIGTEQGKPFADNFITTDAEGHFTAPAEWTDSEPVTFQAPGFVRVTYFGQTAHGQSFQLRPQEGKGHLQLSGQTTGFNVVDGDGLVDFAIVLPAFQRNELFSFDLGSFISSQNDEMDVIGQKINIPSNVSLPQQTENYFLNVTLNKPQYRMYFRTPGTKKVVTLRGQFPFKEVVDQVRQKVPFTELINEFSIQGGSVKTINMTGNTSKNLPVNEMNFHNTRKLTAPDFRDSEMALGIALAEEGGYLYPTDVKNLSSGQGQSLRMNSNSPMLLTVVRRQDESQQGHMKDRLTAVFMPFVSGAQPKPLPLINDPKILSASRIQVPSARPSADVVPVATYASLSAVGEQGELGTLAESLQTVWEAYSNDWINEVDLPTWPGASIQKGKMRWGVTLVGQSAKVGTPAVLGPALMETATHATHSSIDF